MLKLVSFHIQAHLNAFLQILEYFSQICLGASSERITVYINPLNAELNPICPLLALFGAHHILHVSR